MCEGIYVICKSIGNRSLLVLLLTDNLLLTIYLFKEALFLHVCFTEIKIVKFK